MRSLRIAASVAVIVSVTACGGGGGGGGGSAVSSLAAQPSTPATASPAPAVPAESKVVLTVESGGSPATPDTDGNYVITPGKQVLVKAGDAVTWTGNSAGDAVKANEVSITPAQWAVRFSNTDTAAPVVYTLVVKDSGGLEKAVRFSVLPGNLGNGKYMVFGANGSRQSLGIDFDLGSYTLTDRDGTVMQGTLSPPSSAGGTYSARSPLAPQVNGTTLLPKTDAIVGSLPLRVFNSSPAAYAAFPIIATRAFVSSPADLDGVFDRFRVDATPTGRDSSIGQVEISGGGTVFTQCVDNVIYRIELCPAGSRAVSRLVADAEPGMWQSVSLVDGSLLGRISIARIGDEKFYMSGGPFGTSAVFVIGVPAIADYLPFTGGGWSIDGTIDVTSASAGQYSRLTTAPDGIPGTVFTLSPLGANSPRGMRSATDNGKSYFFVRSNALELMVGARGNVATQGFMHIGVPQ